MKKAKLVRHKNDFSVMPMLILDDNADIIAKEIWKTSTTNISLDSIVEDHDCCYLDPGGIYFMKIPHIQFNLTDYQFDVQLTKIDGVLSCITLGKERIPGYWRCPLWYRNLVIPINMYQSLIDKLKTLLIDDKTLHAIISENEFKFDLEKLGYVDFRIPKEKRSD